MDQRKVDFDDLTDAETQPAKIISDPGMATVRASDGNVVPAVQIDATERPDIVALIAAHTPGVVGEAATQWGRRVGAPQGTVTLFLRFHAPARLLIFMDFDVVDQGFLVEEILRAGELYIQAIRTPEAATSEAPSKMRVVVADTGFGAIWHATIEDEITREVQKRGLSATAAKTKAAAIVRSWRSQSQRLS